MHSRLTHGYVVLGSKASARIIIDDAEAALMRYLSAEPLLEKGEGYMSLYTFAPEIRQHHAANPMLPNVPCPTHADWLWFDIDRGTSKENLALALKDTQTLAISLADDFGVDPRDIIAAPSGGKGFHIAIRTSTWNPVPCVDFPTQAGLWAEFIAKKAGIKIDPIYDRMRILRIFNTRHPNSNHFKIPMTYGELVSWLIDEILDRSKAPRAFTVPAPDDRTNPIMTKLWAKCVELAVQKSTGVTELKAGPAKVFVSTIDFIVKGAFEGDRNPSLYKAAVNLADFPDRDSLITGLLFEPAKRSGLGEKEITRTIKNALEGRAV